MCSLELRARVRLRGYRPGRELELLRDDLELGDELLDVAQLPATIAAAAAAVARVDVLTVVGRGGHAVAGCHGRASPGGEGTWDRLRRSGLLRRAQQEPSYSLISAFRI